MINVKDIPQLMIIDGIPILKWGDSEIKIPKLKHGALFLMVNQIATQLRFCEYRIHLDFTKGRVIGNEAVHGLYEHARQFGGIDDEFSLEPGWDPVVVNRGDEGISFFNLRMRNWIGKSSFSEPYVEERSIITVVNNVPILGLPDLIINRSGEPWFIIELKTTNRLVNTRFITGKEAFQAEAYYHMMRGLGFKVNGVAVVKMVRGIDYKIVKDIDALIKLLEDGGTHREIRRGVTVHVVAIRNTAEFNRDIEHALGYWLGVRNAVPSPSPGKCRICDHKSQCPYSMHH